MFPRLESNCSYTFEHLCTVLPIGIQNLAIHPSWIKLAFFVVIFLVCPAWFIYITIAFPASKNSSDVAMCIHNHFDNYLIFRAEILILNRLNSQKTNLALLVLFCHLVVFVSMHWEESALVKRLSCFCLYTFSNYLNMFAVFITVFLSSSCT